jgi:hypothetical protein
MFFKKSKRMTLEKLFQIESCVDSEDGRLLAAPVARHFLLPSPKRKKGLLYATRFIKFLFRVKEENRGVNNKSRS